MRDNTDFEPIVFEDLEPIRIPVTLGKNHYILCEASEADAARWRSESMKGVKMVRGQVAGIEGVGDTQAILVSLCLAETNPDGAMKTIKRRDEEIPVTVPLHVVKGWPSRWVGPLFDRIKKISRLDEPQTEEAIMEQIERLQEELEERRARRNGHVEKTPEGNSRSASTAISD